MLKNDIWFCDDCKTVHIIHLLLLILKNMTVSEALWAFIIGGILYLLIELIYRGHTHISMGFAGGLSFMMLHSLFTLYPNIRIVAKCSLGTVIITSIEYLFGLMLNIKLKLGIWNYSGHRFNLYGQICLRYSLYWAALTIPAVYISKLLHALFA